MTTLFDGEDFKRSSAFKHSFANSVSLRVSFQRYSMFRLPRTTVIRLRFNFWFLKYTARHDPAVLVMPVFTPQKPGSERSLFEFYQF